MAAQRTSDGVNGNHSTSLPISASIFIYKLADGPYFLILHLISYFHELPALFLE